MEVSDDIDPSNLEDEVTEEKYVTSIQWTYKYSICEWKLLGENDIGLSRLALP